LVLLASWAGSARAAVSVESFTVSTTTTQAGSHPDLNVSLAIEDPGEPEAVRSLDVGTPPGFFVYPDAVPQCTASVFSEFECAPVAQVGLVTVRAKHESNPDFLLGTAPVYSLVPGPGEFARFGFVVPTLDFSVIVPVFARIGAASGLDLRVQNLPELAPLASLGLTLWGAPAAPAHDSQRFADGTSADPAGCPGIEGTGCPGAGEPSNAIPYPLLRNPTACTDPPASTLTASSYQDPSDLATADYVGSTTTGCNGLAFEAELTATLTTTAARTATGLELDISKPTQGDMDPAVRADPDTQSIAAALSPDLRLDQDTIEALSACTEAEFDPADTADPAMCPESSKIGSLTANIPGLETPLAGSIYFGGSAYPDAYRVFLSATGTPASAKLVGALESEPETGQMTLSLSDLPQLPFAELNLKIPQHLSLFITNGECGDYAVEGELVPWSAPSEPLLVASGVSLESGPNGGPCPGPAADVSVSLAPPSIVANGHSVTRVTATITDVNGYGIEDEEVAFTSSDPGEKIGMVTDHGDGTYTARITSSTTPGVATITAVDESADPEISGTAQLTQTAEPVASPSSTLTPPPPTPKPPVVSFRRRPPHGTHNRTPTFSFASSEPNSTFRCKVDDKRFRPCASTLTLPRLTFGPHLFEVRAKGPQGLSSKPAADRFVVLPPPVRRH
jgi:hypothetical protein